MRILQNKTDKKNATKQSENFNQLEKLICSQINV